MADTVDPRRYSGWGRIEAGSLLGQHSKAGTRNWATRVPESMEYLGKGGTGIAGEAGLDGDVVLDIDSEAGPSPPVIDLMGDLVAEIQADPP